MYTYKQEFHVFNSKLKPSVHMNYLIAEPYDRKPNEILPMIVCLHGAGERGDNPQLIKVNGIPKMLDKGLTVRAVILAPQVPDEKHIWNTLCDEAAELIDLIAKENLIDLDRISLTGLSMGGYGTWEIGISYSEKFSALAPICGGGVSWRAGVLKNMPIRAFHGDADTAVPVQCTLEMVDRVKAAGGKPELILLHNVGHDSWTFAYAETNLVEWLAAQDKKLRN